MMQLMRLEWIKGNIRKHIYYVVVMTVALLTFLIVTVDKSAGADLASTDYYERSVINAAVEIYTNMAYIVFTGVVLDSFIVAEYEKGTIGLMFSYPIKRRNILLSKIFSVWIFNVVALMTSKIFIYVVLWAIKSFIKISAQDIPFGSLMFWLDMFLSSIVMISISYIALPIGIKTKSSKATLNVTMLIAFFSHGNIRGYTLLGNWCNYILLVVLSVFFIFLSIRNIEIDDVT